jgi:predicted glycosyltransferase
MTIIIVVTHLLGSGHLARALVLAKAFAAAGHKATLVSGGMPVAHLDTSGIDFVQLPPVRSDGVDFSRLLDETGSPVARKTLNARAERLVDLLDKQPPDVLITELYPFGRRILQDEFRAMLREALILPKKPLICCSIRDILAPPSKPAKAASTRDSLSQFYDAILVHSDAEITPLEASWPVTPDIAAKLHYTGFVAPDHAGDHPDAAGTGEVLVTAGGGSVGSHLFEAALQAAALNAAVRWHLLVGGADAEDRVAKLQAMAPSNVVVEPSRPDFRQMLQHAAASVSLCGYNTALDVLQSAAPAVFVPFDDGSEVEQTLRTRALAHLDGIEILTARDLTPDRLLDKVQAVQSAPARPRRTTGFDGGAQTVRIVERLLAKEAP